MCVFIWFQIHYLHLHSTDAFQYVCLKMTTFSFVLASRPRQNDQKRSSNAKRVVSMNDFPVIGHLVMRTGLWDRQGANIASRYKEMYGVEVFLR